jgi:hypothetical protein
MKKKIYYNIIMILSKLSISPCINHFTKNKNKYRLSIKNTIFNITTSNITLQHLYIKISIDNYLITDIIHNIRTKHPLNLILHNNIYYIHLLPLINNIYDTNITFDLKYLHIYIKYNCKLSYACKSLNISFCINPMLPLGRY